MIEWGKSIGQKKDSLERKFRDTQISYFIHAEALAVDRSQPNHQCQYERANKQRLMAYRPGVLGSGTRDNSRLPRR